MKRIFSGVQPSGIIHIGNYLGAIKQWAELQNQSEEAIFCVVDLHAITVRQDPAKLKQNTLSTAAWYIACGINPEKSVIFIQSARPEHTELAWILNCYTQMGELKRMTQYKEKSGISAKEKVDLDKFKNAVNKKIIAEFTEKYQNLPKEKIKENIEKEDIQFTLDMIIKDFFSSEVKTLEEKANAGLFTYPVLMAADILLYQTTDVPVGEDQVQHVELTRDIAKRFNNLYGDTFAIPNYTTKIAGRRIMGLDDPSKKMSKSAASEYNYIALADTPDQISQKIKKAVTDSGTVVKYEKDQPAISNMLNIYSELTGKEIAELEDEFTGKNYGEFKTALTDVITEALAPIQAKYNELIKNPDELQKILSAGAEKVAPLAQSTLNEVKNKIGLLTS